MQSPANQRSHGFRRAHSLLAITLSTIATAQQHDLIINGSFEAGTPNASYPPLGWSTGGTAHRTVETTDGHQAVVADGVTASYLLQGLATFQGRAYDLVFDARSEMAGTATVQIQAGNLTQEIQLGTAWKTWRLRFDAVATDTPLRFTFPVGRRRFLDNVRVMALDRAVNGSFETFGPTTAAYTLANAGDIAGFTVTGGNIEVVNRSAGGFASHLGNHSIDLNGTVPGVLTATVPTTPGHLHYLEFFLSANPDGLPDLKTLNVTFAGTTVPLSVSRTGRSTLSMRWMPIRIPVLVNTTTATISFHSTTAGRYGPAIDAVRVIDAGEDLERVENGGFDHRTANSADGRFTQSTTNSALIRPWSVESGNVEAVIGELSPDLSRTFVDLNGTTGGAIGIWTTTRIGQRYRLTCMLSGTLGNAMVDVFAGTATLRATPPPPLLYRNLRQWRQYALDFTATQTNTRIRFVSLAAGADGVSVDDVRVAPLPDDNLIANGGFEVAAVQNATVTLTAGSPSLPGFSIRGSVQHGNLGADDGMRAIELAPGAQVTAINALYWGRPYRVSFRYRKNAAGQTTLSTHGWVQHGSMSIPIVPRDLSAGWETCEVDIVSTNTALAVTISANPGIAAGLRVDNLRVTERGSHQPSTNVVWLGDVDLDGAEDYAIAEPEFDRLFGRVRVFSGRTGTERFTLLGYAGAQNFGAAVLSVPDSDGDGRRDLLIGAPRGTDAGGRGQVQLRSSWDGQLLSAIQATSSEAELGRSLTLAGDLDGDTVADYGIGTASSIVTVSGRNRSRLGSVGWLDGHFGLAVVGLGGASPAEVATFAAGPMSPRILIYRSGGVLHRSFAAPGVGVAMRSAGNDVDGDGRDDLLFATAGACALLSSANGAVLASTPLIGVRTIDLMADLDGDGLREVLLVGRTTVEVRGGRDLGLVYTIAVEARDVAPADLDRNGAQELLAITPTGALRTLTCERLGSGCVGSNGTPLLLPANGPAFAGRVYRLSARNLPEPTGTCGGFHITGFQNTWHGLPMPADLSGLGWPGCFAWSNDEIVRFFTGTNGRADLISDVPSTATLGTVRTDQILVADPTIARGASVSNGVRTIITTAW